MDKFPIRFIMPGVVVGGIIGKGGATISEIRRESNCKITIANERFDNGDQLLEVCGTATEIEMAFRVILQRCSTGTTMESMPLKVLLYGPQVGAVIGKGGDRVKSLRDCSGCNVKVFREDECLAYAPCRILSFVGPPESILPGVQSMIPFFHEVADQVRTDDMNVEQRMHIMAEQFRMCGGSSGEYAKGGGKGRGAGMRGGKGPSPYSMNSNGMGMRGLKRERGMDMDSWGGDEKRYSSHGHGIPMPAEVGVAMMLEPEQVEVLVGHGGSNISMIRHHTNTKITISGEGDQYNRRQVMIDGTLEQIRSAMNKIYDLFVDAA